MKLLNIIALSALALCASTDPNITEARSRPVMRITSGSVFTWGNNFYGQLGDGTNTDKFSGVDVVIDGLGQPLTNVVAVAAGGGSTYVIKSDGTVWAWGSNQRGQLGDGTTTDSLAPVQVQGLTGVIAVAAGLSHAVAIKSDGTVWAWGSNTDGELGDGSTTDSFTPVQVNGLTGVIAVAAGSAHTLALKSDGTVLAWGSNSFLQLGYEPAGIEPLPVVAFTGAVAIAAGEGHSIAVKNDGTVWAWGDSQLVGSIYSPGPGPALVSGLAGVTAVASHGSHTVALKSDGTVWTWGNNQFGQLGNGTNDPIGRTPSWSHTPAAQVNALNNVIAVTAGMNHTLALMGDGTVWVWGTYLAGNPAENQPTVENNLPVQVSGLATVAAVASGYDHAIAIINTPPPPPAPVLSYSGETGYGTDGVNPDTGAASTVFIFKTVYLHTGNLAPTSVNVCIDGACSAMSQDTTATDPVLRNGDFTDGEQYAFTTTLAVGSHAYHFEASDGTITGRLPETGELTGPTEIDFSIITPTVAEGAEGAPYSLALSASGGTGPYTWSAPGFLVGFRIDPATGVLSNSSPLEGIYTFTVFVTDANGLTASTSIMITINAFITPPPEQAFNIIDLGTLGGQFSAVTAMNSSGQVTGYSYTANGVQHAFLYSNGVMTDLGSLPGAVSITPSAINGSGQVVGFCDVPSGRQAFLYSNGVMTDIGSLGGRETIPFAINNSGQVVGQAFTVDGSSHAFLYSSSVGMTDLGTLGGPDSTAYAINNSGQVVGAADKSTGGFHAFLYGNGGMTDLGALGGGTFGHSEGRKINDLGQVAGQSTAASSPQHAFFYDRGVMNDIGTGGLWSFVNAMSSSGQVVGYAFKGTGGYHAFLYDHGAMIDLGTLGGARSWAIAVNGSGTTVGASTTVNGQRAFIYRNGVMKAISSTSPAWQSLDSAVTVNDNGQIAGIGRINGQTHAFMFTAGSLPGPDLSVRKLSDKATAGVGETVHYTIEVSNGTNAGATYGEIMMTDTLPVGLTIDSTTLGNLRVPLLPGELMPFCTVSVSPQVITCTWAYSSVQNQLPPGGTWTLEYDAVVDLGILPTGQTSATLTNTATVTACSPTSSTCTALPEPNLSDNTATATVNVRSPDLAVRKLSDKTTAGVGETVHYTIEVSNGPTSGAASGVFTMTDTLPTGLTINSATPGNPRTPLVAGEPQPTCTVSGTPQVLTCTWITASTLQQTLLPSGKWTVEYDAVIDAAALPAGQISAPLANTATVTACPPNPRCVAFAEPNLSDNTTTATVTVRAPDLAMRKLSDKATAGVGETVHFTIEVSNGPTSGAASGVFTMTDTLPTGLTINSATPGNPRTPLVAGEPQPTCTVSGTPQVLTCTWITASTLQQTLLPSGKWTVEYDAVIDAAALPAGQASAPLTNTATVTACPPNPRCVAFAEPNLSDNTATATVNVRSPDLAVRKLSDKTTAGVGEMVHYTIEVSNGPTSGAASGVFTMTDTLPTGLTINSATPGNPRTPLVAGEPQPTCTVSGTPQVLTCTWITASTLQQMLLPSGKWTVEYDAVIDAGALPAGQASAPLTNTATVTACPPNPRCVAFAEPNLSDNTTTANITVIAANNFSIAMSPLVASLTQGATATYTITTALTSGVAENVSLAVSGLPTGLTGSFSPASVSAGGSSTLTLSASVAATVGTATFTVTGTSASATHTATASITVTAPNDFSVTMSPLIASLTQGANTTFTITTVLTSGVAENVSLAVSGLPPGVAGSFSPASVTAGGSSTLTLGISASTPGGTATITVTGTSASSTHTATASLTVSARNNVTVIGPAGPITISSPPGTSLHAVSVSPVLGQLPPGVQFPYGMISFSVAGVSPGGTITVMISLPGPVNSYWKILGPSGSFVPVQNAVFQGNNVILTLTDGVAPFDNDGIANGEIVDPGAPGILNVPPTVNAGPNQTIDATAPTGASVKFSGSGSDPDGGTLMFSWSGPCGLASSAVAKLTCPLGVNNMTLTVNDGHGGVASAMVSIIVLRPLGIKQSVLSAISALRATVAGKEDQEKLDEVIRHLTKSLDVDFWVNPTHLQLKHGEKVFNEDKESIDTLLELISDKKSDIPDPVLQVFISRMINADRLLVLLVIADAQQQEADPASIDKANEELLKGDKALAKGNCDDAMDHYLHAWKLVMLRPGLGRD